MRAFIRWIFFENKDLGKFIRNEENNENWPGTKAFPETINNWWKEIDKQQEEINKLEIKNNKTRELMTEVQKWFIEEYNLLSKPAKRAWLEKNARLKRLEKELKIHQHNLDHPKQELEEYEKKCLLKKIEIGERKIGSCKDELKEAEEAYEKEKRELCQRLAYSKEDIPETFLRNSEERIDPITRKLVIDHEDYSKWWRIGKEIDEESKPLEELRKRIDKWYEHNEGKGPEYNPYEIWVEEKTDDSVTFLWKPVERELESLDEKGEKKKIKGQYLALCKNYLFNYYGEWYEVADYYQTNYTTAIIIAQRSIFYNDYRGLVHSQANVIIHHAPPEIASQEICSCPNYEVYTSRNNFDLEYELLFDLYVVSKEEEKRCFEIDDPEIKMFGMGRPRKVENISGEKAIRLGIMDEELRRQMRPDPNTPDFATDALMPVVMGLGHLFSGQKGALYFLLSKNLAKIKGRIWTYEIFECPTSESARSNKNPNIYFKRVGEFDNEKAISKLTDETKEKFLEERGLLKKEMFHFLEQHIQVILYWRKKPIWKGNYWILHNQMRIIESVDPAGTCVTIMGSGLILARVKELITSKIGGDEQTKGFLSTLITVATTVVSAAMPAAGAAGVAMKTGVGLAGSLTQTAVNQMMSSPGYEEFSETMSIHEFRHRYMISKTRPISLQLNYNQELANQYLNKRELKGPMLYTYKNLGRIGDIFAPQPSAPSGHFVKASVVSWNMPRNSEWFRRKIESGIFIYHKNYLNFYETKLTVGKSALSRGGITLGDWNEFVFEKTFTVGITRDGVSQHGGGMWIWKDSELNLHGVGNKMSWLIDNLESKFKILNRSATDNLKWVISHPGTPIDNYRLDIPVEWRNQERNGMKTVRVEYWLRSFGEGGNMVEQTKALNEHYCTHFIINKFSRSNTTTITLGLVGENKIGGRGGNPQGIPPSENLPINPNEIDIPPSTPFNPNQFSQSGNLLPNPTGSGEQEINVPDIDNDYDPDFDQGIDIDPGQDIDPTKDKDADESKDDDLPPDNPFDTDDND